MIDDIKMSMCVGSVIMIAILAVVLPFIAIYWVEMGIESVCMRLWEYKINTTEKYSIYGLFFIWIFRDLSKRRKKQ